MDGFSIESLWGLTTAQKLIWFYLYVNGEGFYSTRQISLALELSTGTVNTAMKVMLKRGFIQELEPARGSRPARICVVTTLTPPFRLPP